jgi:hypothetical protein
MSCHKKGINLSLMLCKLVDRNSYNAYDLVKTIAFKCNLGNTVIKINHGCGFLLVDTVNESKNDFEDWGLWCRKLLL